MIYSASFVSSVKETFSNKANIKALLLLILVFTFVTRIVRLHLPERYIFDEVYHAVTAKLIAKDDPRAFEWWNPPPEPDTAVDWLHPPLAKYTQALSIRIFGENSFAWRLSSVIFGTGVVWVTYRLAATVFKNQAVALLAAFITSLDGLVFTQSRIAMNDIHVTFFILLTFYLYAKYRDYKLKHPFSRESFWKLAMVGVSGGFAMASKWSGLFAVLTVGLFEAVDLLSYSIQTFFQPLMQKRPAFKAGTALQDVLKIKLSVAVTLIVIPIFIYVASYAPMFLQGKSLFCSGQTQIQGQCYFERIEWNGDVVWEGYISHFAMLHRQIWWYQTNLDADHPFESTPYQWFFNLRPVWFHVTYGEGSIGNIYAFGNPAIFWLGASAVIASLIALLLSWTPTKTKLGLFYILVCYALLWMPWISSPRIMFFYHYTPAVPLMAILLAFWIYRSLISKHSYKNILGILMLGSVVLSFVIWYPHWTGILVPKQFADTVYFAIESWR